MILSYARVSTAEQAADGTTSLAEQEKKNRAVATLRNAGSFDFVSYVDKGVSGAIPLRSRPAGRQMLESAQPGDTIIASKLDRIFRSASDALVTLEKLQEQKVDLILVDMGVDPITANGPAKLFFSMLVSFAEFERHRITERITDGKRAKKEKGGHLGGQAPYGYQCVGAGKDAKLEPFEAEQIILRQINALSDKYKPARVVRELEGLGIVNRAGKPFQIVHVQRFAQRG